METEQLVCALQVLQNMKSEGLLADIEEESGVAVATFEQDVKLASEKMRMSTLHFSNHIAVIKKAEEANLLSNTKCDDLRRVVNQCWRDSQQVPPGNTTGALSCLHVQHDRLTECKNGLMNLSCLRWRTCCKWRC